MYHKVELCGVDTAALPVLDEEEKRALLTAARAGDKEARRRMIEGNLRLVLAVVQRFAQRGENLDDLFQVGCIGLIKAHRPLRPPPTVERCVFHLRRAHDPGGDTAVPAGITIHCGSAVPCGIPPAAPCRSGNSWKSSWAGNPP